MRTFIDNLRLAARHTRGAGCRERDPFASNALVASLVRLLAAFAACLYTPLRRLLPPPPPSPSLFPRVLTVPWLHRLFTITFGFIHGYTRTTSRNFF